MQSMKRATTIGAILSQNATMHVNVSSALVLLLQVGTDATMEMRKSSVLKGHNATRSAHNGRLPLEKASTLFRFLP